MQINPHSTIIINNLSITFRNKVCFTDFNASIYYSQRIGIIGRNGSGKSSLIKVLANQLLNYDGDLSIPDDVYPGYVSQIIQSYNISGGQKFNSALSQALSLMPNLLLLDEPTNHLDKDNHRSLLQMLRRYNGTLIMVTHDIKLLNECVDIIWHIDNGKISVFNGSYDNYIELNKRKYSDLQCQVKQLNKQKLDVHERLMKEQSRAKNSRKQGQKSIEQSKWPTVIAKSKAITAESTAGQNRQQISNNKARIMGQLNDIYIPEEIIPKFYLDGKSTKGLIVNVVGGSCAYGDHLVVSDVNFTISDNQKAIIVGNNASGKSTIFKALIRDHKVTTSGTWNIPQLSDIGYLDQHYLQLDITKTSIELLEQIRPNWGYTDLRDHLNTFLLRKNEEVNLPIQYLSGGEKVRLSLALIAANPPKLLLLDEVTNNIDLETKDHMIDVLCRYPGAFILICHDIDFISKLSITNKYSIKDGLFITMF